MVIGEPLSTDEEVARINTQVRALLDGDVASVSEEISILEKAHGLILDSLLK